jgi:hypothetical protein
LLTERLLPYFHKVGLADTLSDIAPRVSGTNMDYEQYPGIGRNPSKVIV